MTDLSMILLTSALFLAALLSLTANSRIRSRITGLAAAAAACVGMVLYGFGFAWTLGPGPVAALRALLALCRMFAGVNELSAIQATPWFSSQAVLTVFWLGHFLAFYATASAAIATLGGRLLRFIRFRIFKVTLQLCQFFLLRIVIVLQFFQTAAKIVQLSVQICKICFGFTFF